MYTVRDWTFIVWLILAHQSDPVIGQVLNPTTVKKQITTDKPSAEDDVLEKNYDWSRIISLEESPLDKGEHTVHQEMLTDRTMFP